MVYKLLIFKFCFYFRKGRAFKMLQITARVFKDNQLVGYRLTDGNQTQDLTKVQTWMYAKNKQIINVTAAGTQDNPSLSGTNGFELKKLPEVKFKEPTKFSIQNRYDTIAIRCSLIRYVLKNGVKNIPADKKELDTFSKQVFKDDVDCGKIKSDAYRKYTPSVLITHSIIDESNPTGSVTLGTVNKSMSESDKAEYREQLNIASKLLTELSNLLDAVVSIGEEICREDHSVYINTEKLKSRLIRHSSVQVVHDIKNKYPDYKKFAQEFMSMINNLTDKPSITLDGLKKSVGDSAILIKNMAEMASKQPVPETYQKRELVETGATIGYVIKNIGNEPIAVDRLSADGNRFGTVALNPGQSIGLSRVEMTLFAAKIEFCGEFANARLACASKRGFPDIYSYLNAHYIKQHMDEDSIIKHDITKIDIRKVVSPEDIQRHFKLKPQQKKQA